jgi:predicted enzyme related to lactoylglutathione lyase
MPTRDAPWAAGTPCWTDIAVPDLPAAVQFYSTVLGWTPVDMGEQFHHFHVAMVDGRAAAGIGPVLSADQPTYWTVYLATDDADATAKLIVERGGSLLVDPMDVGENGRMAIATDPTGGVFGLWQAGTQVGHGIYNEPGALIWEDARLTDPAGGQRFYADVFGYGYQPVPGAPDDYRTFHLGDDPPLGGMGGLMGAPEGTRSHWLTYFCVPDADAAVAAVEAGGGAVVGPAETTPYGRMAAVTDPFGAPFMVLQEP